MIISHKYKFIYIKNRKVGSTSMEVALQKICGPDDVLTPDHLYKSADDVLLAEARHYQGRFNPARELLQSRSAMDAARVMRDFYKRPVFYNHMRASSVKARIPRDIWNNYYKFCFDRNPWDKCVSFYYWYGKGKSLPPFDAFIQKHKAFGTTDQTMPSDWCRYTLHDRIIVDDVFDYADMEGNLQRALGKAGVPEEVIARVRIGNEKTTLRKRDTLPLSAQSDQLIRSVFHREIDRFSFCKAPPEGLFAG